MLVTHAILETRIHPPSTRVPAQRLCSLNLLPLPLDSTMNFPRKGTSLGPGTPLVSSRPTAGTFCPNSVPAWFGLSLHQGCSRLFVPQNPPHYSLKTITTFHPGHSQPEHETHTASHHPLSIVSPHHVASGILGLRSPST